MYILTFIQMLCTFFVVFNAGGRLVILSNCGYYRSGCTLLPRGSRVVASSAGVLSRRRRGAAGCSPACNAGASGAPSTGSGSFLSLTIFSNRQNFGLAAAAGQRSSPPPCTYIVSELVRHINNRKYCWCQQSLSLPHPTALTSVHAAAAASLPHFLPSPALASPVGSSSSQPSGIGTAMTNPPCSTLFVANLGQFVSEHELKEIFSR